MGAVGDRLPILNRYEMLKRNRSVLYELLERAAASLEATQREHGRCNHLAARYAGNAAVILSFDDLADRFSRLLSRLTAAQYWAGVITNIPLTDRVPKGARQLDDRAKLDNEYPVFPSNYASSLIGTSEPHLHACLTHDYDTAFANATDELKVTELVLAQAILGDTEIALQSTQRLAEQHRLDLVLMVVVIERFRHGDLDGAYPIFNSLDPRVLDIWGAPQMALGIANRVPWGYYPFPDY